MKHEELVQRFIDQELSTTERVQFVVALGRDPELRERVIELEQLVADAADLPKPIVPPGFAARVLAQTSAARPAPAPAWRRIVDACLAPRALQWNLAGAAAVAALLVAVGLSLVMTGRRPAPTVAVSAPAQPGNPVVLVRLVIVQPGARVVQAAGDFNGWNPRRTPLEQTSDGAWTVTLPLQPGRYEYQFVVDGEQWIGDPFAVEQSDDGFGSQNAVLDVRPPAEAL